MTTAATPTSLPALVLPAYASASLADLMPALGSHLGVPGGEDTFALPAAARYVVVLVDGLGWNLLRRSAREVPYLAGLLAEGRPITAGVPSTTVTSLTSLGTGLPPGQHGMVGYTYRVPETGEILNALTWESDLVARVVQPRSTFFERAVGSGVAVSSVGLERFAGSGLTQAALRGAEFVPFEHERAEEKRISLIRRAALRGERTLVYAYERQLDHVGHASGSDSEDWLRQLIRVDAMVERLREALPDDVVLLVTGDHGMVDVPASHQVVAEDEPDLMAGVTALAGEGRFRQLYVDTDDPAAVAARWRDHLGNRAWVRTRDEAVAEGWFGPVSDDVRERLGHVLVALRDSWAVMTRQYPRELSLVGMHGSLTPAEMLVPLLLS